MSQCARVLAVLEDSPGEWVSIQTIHNRAGTMRLNSRVSELREQGHNIEYRYIDGQHSYRLLSGPDEAACSPALLSSGSESITHTLLSGPAKAPEGLPTALAGPDNSVAECLICGQRMLGYGLRCDDCKQRALDGSEATYVGQTADDGHGEPVGAAASLPSSAGEQMRLVAQLASLAPSAREIEQMEHDQRLLREAVALRNGTAFRCMYCGGPCYGRTCRNHRDLLDIELERERGRFQRSEIATSHQLGVEDTPL